MEKTNGNGGQAADPVFVFDGKPYPVRFLAATVLVLEEDLGPDKLYSSDFWERLTPAKNATIVWACLRGTGQIELSLAEFRQRLGFADFGPIKELVNALLPQMQAAFEAMSQDPTGPAPAAPEKDATQPN